MTIYQFRHEKAQYMCNMIIITSITCKSLMEASPQETNEWENMYEALSQRHFVEYRAMPKTTINIVHTVLQQCNAYILHI